MLRLTAGLLLLSATGCGTAANPAPQLDASTVDGSVAADARPAAQDGSIQDGNIQDAAGSVDGSTPFDGTITRDATLVRDTRIVDNGIGPNADANAIDSSPVADSGTTVDTSVATCPSLEGSYRLSLESPNAACAPVLQCLVSNQSGCGALITCAPPGTIGPRAERIAFQSVTSDVPRTLAWQGDYQQGAFRVYSNDSARLIVSRSCTYAGMR